MKVLIRCAAIGVLALAIWGCATAGRKIDQAAVEKIQKGQTTKAEVKSLIGAPDQVMKDGDGNETWTYMYVRAVVKGESFIPVVGAFAGGSKTQNQMTIVHFDSNGVVKQVQTSYGGMDVDSGLSAGGPASTPSTTDGKRPK